MARKSAAKVRPVNNRNSDKFLKGEELPPIEETFDKAKQAFINTAEVACTLAGRVDNLINLRKAYYEYWHDDISNKYLPKEAIKYLKDMQATTVACYENIADVVRSFELEEFLKEDMKDYFEFLMPNVDDIEFDKDLFKAFIEFGIIKPWGEKMNQLHYQMLDEKKARKEIDDE